MQKVVLFVFNGDPMCFIHVLLNALDMKARAMDCRVVVEGAATQLIPGLAAQDEVPELALERGLDIHHGAAAVHVGQEEEGVGRHEYGIVRQVQGIAQADHALPLVVHGKEIEALPELWILRHGPVISRSGG